MELCLAGDQLRLALVDIRKPRQCLLRRRLALLRLALELRDPTAHLRLARRELELARIELARAGRQPFVATVGACEFRLALGEHLLARLELRLALSELALRRGKLQLALVELARTCGELAVISGRRAELLLALRQQLVARLHLGACLGRFLLERRDLRLTLGKPLQDAARLLSLLA